MTFKRFFFSLHDYVYCLLVCTTKCTTLNAFVERPSQRFAPTSVLFITLKLQKLRYVGELLEAVPIGYDDIIVNSVADKMSERGDRHGNKQSGQTGWKQTDLFRRKNKAEQ